jgi:hypothetical protein
MEDSMTDDLRTRYDAINAKAEKLTEHVQTGVTSPAMAFGVSALLVEAMGLARDAMERLEAGEKGESEIRECEIEGRGIDIREFTCRQA